jgi:hypothetical protein
VTGQTALGPDIGLAGSEGAPVKTVIVTALLVDVVGEGHVAFDVRITCTTCPLVQVARVKVLLAVGDPWLTPPICHWYSGDVPPFTGVAVKVTDVLLQIEFDEATILTEGVTSGFTVIVNVFDEAGVPVAHGLALDVKTTFTTSPFTKPVEL